jgi:hypothetical protein
LSGLIFFFVKDTPPARNIKTGTLFFFTGKKMRFSKLAK